jgi:hypothetical protein
MKKPFSGNSLKNEINIFVRILFLRLLSAAVFRLWFSMQESVPAQIVKPFHPHWGFSSPFDRVRPSATYPGRTAGNKRRL